MLQIAATHVGYAMLLSGRDRADSEGIISYEMLVGTLPPSLYLFDISLHTPCHPLFPTLHQDVPYP